MDHLEIAPAAALRPWVRCLWWLAAPAPDGEAPVEKVLPDGCVELIVHLGGPYRHVRSAASPGGRARTLVGGQLTRFLELQQVEAVEMVAVRFEPGGAWPFLRRPLGELTGRVVPLDELAADLSRELLDAVDGVAEPRARMAAVQRVLLARRPGPDRRDGLVEHATRRLVAGAGRLSVGALADELGISARQLGRRFDERVGLSPKALARTLRFQAVLAAVDQGPPGRWAAVAAACGFSDQAHLIREFRRFSGERPPELVAGDRGLTHLMLHRAER